LEINKKDKVKPIDLEQPKRVFYCAKQPW